MNAAIILFRKVRAWQHGYIPARVTERGQGSVVPQAQWISHFLLAHKSSHDLPKTGMHKAPLEEGYWVYEPNQA